MRPAGRVVLRAFGIAVAFVLALGASVLVHLDQQVVRRTVLQRVNRALASAFAGHLVLEQIGGLGASHIDGLDTRIDDPDGRTVLHVHDVHGRLSTFALVRSLVTGSEIVVDVSRLSAARAEVSLDSDASGTLRLVKAFAESAPSSGSASRGVRVELHRVHVGHVSLAGQPSAAISVDADVDEVQGSVIVMPGTMEIHVAHADLVARGLPSGATATGSLEAHLAQPSARGGDRAVHAVWRGALSGVEETVDASYDGGEVVATLDVPGAKPEVVRALWPQSPLEEVASMHVEAWGTLPNIFVRARAAVGHGRLEVAGPVSLGDETRASLLVDATAIDAHALSAAAPQSDLSASGQVVLAGRASGAGGGVVLLDIAGGTVGRTPVPPATLVGQFQHDPLAPGPITAHATLAVREPGAPTELSLRLARSGSSLQIAFDATTTVPSLESVPRLGLAARGHASASAHGTVDLGADRLNVQIDASAGDVAFGGIRLKDATMTTHATGKLQAPWVDAELRGEGLEAGALRFATVHAEAHGLPMHAPVDVSLHGYGADMRARADVSLAGGVATLGSFALTVEDQGERVIARAPLVVVSASELRVDDADIDGLGAPLHASVRQSPGILIVRARSHGLDVARLARLVRFPQTVAGRVSLDVDASLQHKGAQGHVVLDLSGGAIAGWRGAKAHVEATLEGRRASGHATASLGDLGSIDMQSSSIELGGADPLTVSSWRRTWGRVDFGAHVDLAKLVAQLPAGALPLSQVSGALDVKGRVERDSAIDTTPDVDVTAGTTGLVLVGPKGPAPWHIEGVDTTTHLQVDGSTGHTSLDAQLTDATGVLVTLGATSDAVPYARLFLTDDPAFAALETMPFDAALGVPERAIDSLPTALSTKGLRGRLRAEIGWRGTLLQPTIDATARIRQGRTAVTLLALPVDLDLSAHYDGSRVDAALSASARGRKVLDASSELDARAAAIIAGFRGATIPWTASGRAELTRFPLQSIGAVDDRQVRANASGQLTLTRLHDDASATLALALDGLRVGEVACKSAQVQASVDGHALDVSVRVDQQDGFAEMQAHAGSRWGSAMTPTIDASQPADVSLTARQLRAVLLLPFVADLFAQLDGRVDANARIQVDPRARTVQPQGTIAVQGGVVELNSIGGEFHDVSATIVLTPDGVVRLENASARGLTGRLEAAATARFNGLAFGGARAQLQVPKNEPVPLIFEGVQLGVVDGRLSLAVDPAADRSLSVNVDVPSLHVQLPLSSTHDVQALGGVEGVRVLVHRGADWVPVQLDGGDASSNAHAARTSPVRIAVHLGNDVQVQRGTDLDVRLEGEPSVVLADTVRASGQVRILRGTIDVQGKPFTIDHGTVTFVGDDPSNPQVSLTATWTAPDGTRIYADFIGPLKTGKVALRSEPSRTKNEILALILFGTTDEQAPTSTGASQQASTAVGAAGGAATQPINRALGGVNHALDNFGLAGGISTKVDTSQTTPRPEVELQIARDISLQVAWVLGVPPPGTNPDTTLFTLNWRFLRQWSLQTTVGDAGTSILDLIWQHRY